MARRKDEGLPVAVATQGGLVATLAVLVIGLARGGRAWIVLIQAAGAFLLASGLLKILTAALIQGIRMKANAPPPKADETEETARVIEQAARPFEPTGRMAS
jgi:hypothetical protein